MTADNPAGTFIAVHITDVRWARNDPTNSRGGTVIHGIWLNRMVPSMALVEFERYMGSSHPGPLWQRALEVRPLSDFYAVSL